MCVELLGPMAWMTGVMNEEEYQKHRVRRWKCDAGDDVDRLGDPYRVRWHFTLVAAAVVPNTLIFLQQNQTQFIRVRFNVYKMIYSKTFLTKRKNEINRGTDRAGDRHNVIVHC